MSKKSAWPFCAFAALALAAAGCRPSSGLKGGERVLQVGAEKPSEDPSTAATASRARASTQFPKAQDQAASASIEVAAEAIQPHLAIGGGGGIFLAFIQRGNISVSISHDRGKSFGAPVVAIDVGGRARGGMHRGPRIGVDEDENITVTAPVTFDQAEYKKRYPTADLFLVRSTDGGKTWSKPRRVNEVAKRAPEALHWMTVAPRGEAHVAWLDRREREQPGQDLYYTTVVDGNVGANVKVASTVCECCAPGLAVDAAGNPLLAFREGGSKPSREIFSRWSTNGGRSFAEAMRINRRNTLEDG